MAVEMTRRLLQSPADDVLAAILAEIQAATATLRVIMYAWVWPDLTALIIAKHQAGVDVRLVLDKVQFAGHSEHPEVLQMQASGVPIVIRESEAHHIVHDKIFIIDGSTVIRGSFNATVTAEKEDNFIEVDTGNPVWADAFTAEFDRLWQTAPPPAAQPAP